MTKTPPSTQAPQANTHSTSPQNPDAWQALLDVVAKLRDPQGGCPWDLEQTHESLTPYVVEEAYEVVDAIRHERGDLAGELGDLLLQVVLHSQIASEEGTFSINDVLQHLTKKLIHRHPHVFGDTKVSSTKEVLENWEKLKRAEKSSGDSAETAPKKKSVISGVPKSMPALFRAHRLGEKVSRVGFDWTNSTEVLTKVREELKEFEEAISQNQGEAAEFEELGDLLFVLAQWARKKGRPAEELLNEANEKFIRRFTHLELAAGDSLDHQTPQELEVLWQKAKEAVG